MTEEHMTAERHTWQHAGGIHVFDLDPMVRAMQDTDEYRSAGRTGLALVKVAEQRVVLEALRHGTHLSTHQVSGPVTVQVLLGEVRLEAEGEILYLRTGQVLYLPSSIAHSVEAMKDSALLITISPR